MFTRRGLSWLSLVSGVGVLWCAVLIGTLAFEVRPVITQLAVGFAAILTVPGFAAGILANRRGYRTQQPRRLWSLASWVPPHVPVWAAIAAALIFAGFWLALVLAFAALNGSPLERGGTYVLMDRGRETIVGRAVYERQIDHETQISLAVLGAFAVGGTFLCAARATDHDDH
ncbi:hypothetical protein [Actinoplanes derwentensis]|uniref:Uncharacterized protein n=1 Tax=Actinoplanes derwentensis TaxID=113562 RepID=A0A1H2DBF9_9ACTN|nr:hypothetical protein [Actinoplanes derwentensis]GID81780.1 hypothetical protein Ade03nite_07040 [Actinoplanes derwentensis]SDT79832.1 hypothetical protein SAMN04489716_8949 [Actinoplanes derwentensis]